MADKPPESEKCRRHLPNEAEVPSADEDESVEILEVVGVDETGARVKESDSTPEPPSSDEDEAIPYSQRELYEMLLRKQADFENAKKRLNRERDELSRRAWCQMVKEFLPVLDNFDRALAEPTPAAADAFRKGVALTVQQMRDGLIRQGLEEISALGERFDPHVHEAVEILRVDGFEEGLVLEVLRKGYKFRGELLRPVLVKVSAKGTGEGSK